MLDVNLLRLPFLYAIMATFYDTAALFNLWPKYRVYPAYNFVQNYKYVLQIVQRVITLFAFQCALDAFTNYKSMEEQSISSLHF